MKTIVLIVYQNVLLDAEMTVDAYLGAIVKRLIALILAHVTLIVHKARLAYLREDGLLHDLVT